MGSRRNETNARVRVSQGPERTAQVRRRPMTALGRKPHSSFTVSARDFAGRPCPAFALKLLQSDTLLQQLDEPVGCIPVRRRSAIVSSVFCKARSSGLPI